ncbi:MAG TPA: penicillin-binding protein 1A [Firmicutes bacterium]|nr:penicillin-binding protein 1A [Bacillota bacterium]
MQVKRRNDRGGIAIFFIFIIAIILGALAGAFAGFLRSAPTLAEVKFDPKLTTYVYDAKGRVITRFFKENRDPVPLVEIPLYLRHAVIAIEDERFYSHHGIDLRSTLRALWVNAKAKTIKQGGSTITQQLAKNAFLSHERTWTRKLRELLWTIQIERAYTKDEILEAYLNLIYFGHGAHGVAAAAQTYFGKPVQELTLAEAAFIAGVSRSPSLYSPYINPEAAVKRRNLILDVMAEQGYISRLEAEMAKATPLEVKPLKKSEENAPYFADYILQQLLELYGENRVYGGGLKVYTTLDLDIQKAAEKALLSGLPTIKEDKNGLKQPQGAVIAIEPQTGHIKAMVGGRGTDQFNRAVQAYRQPGSAIKPLIYAAALEAGYAPASVFVDEPLELTLQSGEKWRPENNNKTYRGSVSLRQALTDSINIVAVKLLLEIGAEKALAYMKRLGITSLVETGTRNDTHPALALGGLTRGMSPLELVAAYAVFANGGIYVKPTAITKIEDAKGQVIYTSRPERRIVMSEALAYMMTDMLQDVISHGTGTAARLDRPAAGKTGTTSDYTNAWFIGYTPELAAAVWIGNDRQVEAMITAKGPVGSSQAALIWSNFMKQALSTVPSSSFAKPQRGLAEDVAVDTRNGLPIMPNCQIPPEFVGYELFLEDRVPARLSPACL